MKMSIGLWNPLNKKIMEELEKGQKQVTLGIEVNHLLDLINAMEYEYGGNAVTVLSALKGSCLMAAGKLQSPEAAVLNNEKEV
jgi:hypothetical protein